MTSTVTTTIQTSDATVPGIGSGTLTYTRTNTGTDVATWTQNIDNSGVGEVLSVPSDIGTIGEIVIKNLSSADTIELAQGTASAFGSSAAFDAAQFAQIRPGGIAVLQPLFISGNTKIHARYSGAGAIDAQIWAVEE